MGFYDISFVDEKDIKENALSPLDVLLMSGGDTFAVAGGLESEGSDRIRRFIEEGGLYIGTCAGAYLPLNSSMYPLSLFNFINMKISNISRKVPGFKPLQKNFCTPYGCDLIFHAVREDVLLGMNNGHKVNGNMEVIAPLYGGPAMLPSEDVEAIAHYKGFTQKTKFFVDEELAKETLIGNVAVAKKSFGGGFFYIFGPHFEHPGYPMCNKFIADIIYKDAGKKPIKAKNKNYNDKGDLIKGRELKDLLRDLKRELSNSRIASSWTNDLSLYWKIGSKYYGTEKIAVFISFIWDKFRYLESMRNIETDRGKILRCIKISECITKDLKDIRSGIREDRDTTQLASRLFQNLKILCSSFLSFYFQAKARELCVNNLGSNN